MLHVIGTGNNVIGLFFLSLFFSFFFKLNSTIIVSLDGDPGPVKIFGQLCFGSWWVSHTAVVQAVTPAEGSSGCLIN